MYLAIGIFLMFQAIFNMGCAGGACATNIPHKNDKTVMEFEKYESSKTNKNV